MSHQPTSSSSVARLPPVDLSTFIGRAVRETGRCRQTQSDLTLIFRPAVGFHQAAFSPALEGIEGFCFSQAQLGYRQWAILTRMSSDSRGYKVETDPRPSHGLWMEFHSSLEPNQLSFTPIDPRPLIPSPI